MISGVDEHPINGWVAQISEKGARLAMLNRLWILTWANAQWELWDREQAPGSALGAATL